MRPPINPPVAVGDVVHQVKAVEIDARPVREDLRAAGDLIDRLKAPLEDGHPDEHVEKRRSFPAGTRQVGLVGGGHALHNRRGVPGCEAVQ